KVGVILAGQEIGVERHPEPAYDLARRNLLGHEHPLAVALQRLEELFAVHLRVHNRVVRERDASYINLEAYEGVEVCGLGRADYVLSHFGRWFTDDGRWTMDDGR